VDIGEREARAQRAAAAAQTLRDQEIAAVALTFVDNAGITRVKTVPVGRLEQAASWGVGISPVFEHFLVDDSIAKEGGPIGDLRLMPDVDRLTVLSAQPGLAWAPADKYTQDGDPYPGCQRGFARRMAEAAAKSGLTALMGFEIEWVVGENDDEGGFVPACTGPAYGMGRIAETENYVAELHAVLASQGVEVLQIHPEYTAGQFEVSVAPSDPVGAADTTVLVRETIRSFSHSYGMRASFAPVVFLGGVGNGGHLHFSLRRDGRNLFAGGDGPSRITSEIEPFLATVLADLPALVAIGSPAVTSYLRLVPSRWAGAYQCWGSENREAAMRLVTGSVGEEDRVANVELKCFDQAANPYLLAGAVLASGLAGLAAAAGGGRKLPEQVQFDPGSLAVEDCERLGISRLPQSLDESLGRLEHSETLPTAMGQELFDAFVAVRRAEIERFADRPAEYAVSKTRFRY
jgi:glutamine synthetase